MKKHYIQLIAILLTVIASTCMVSCGDDDDNEQTSDISIEKLKGHWRLKSRERLEGKKVTQSEFPTDDDSYGYLEFYESSGFYYWPVGVFEQSTGYSSTPYVLRWELTGNKLTIGRPYDDTWVIKKLTDSELTLYSNNTRLRADFVRKGDYRPYPSTW